jgi:hypothetical protein
MLLLNFGQSAETITVTLNEKRTLETGYYLFLFTHYTTKQVVSKIYLVAEDDSNYPDRYNEFEINTDAVFLGAPVGMWQYRVYEQESSTNIDPAGLTELESGIMQLLPATQFNFEEYDGSTTFAVYRG